LSTHIIENLGKEWWFGGRGGGYLAGSFFTLRGEPNSLTIQTYTYEDEDENEEPAKFLKK
jgi:hypothetical protein